MNWTIYSLFTLNTVYPHFENLYISTRNCKQVLVVYAPGMKVVFKLQCYSSLLSNAYCSKKVPLGRLEQVDFLAG